MDRLADSKALIIDLRTNGGGNRESVALFASYFFDQPTHLSDVVAPRTGERLSMWTRKDVDGKPYGSTRPVYILTSRATFSAAEDFAYAMQTRKRAIIVGEVTRGGAHPKAPFRLTSHFVALIPVAETISPITRTNWEGVGVQPDIVAPADDARSVATAAILKKQLAGEADAMRRARMK
jgi:C-terminal processing protease CtpA/Prc